MATWKFQGLDQYIAKLERLTAHTEESMKRVVWEGARVVADGIHSSLNGIPVQDEYVREGETRVGVSSEDKATIVDNFGLAHMWNEGNSIVTKAGFNKNSIGLIRKVESGTSYMKKHPVVRQGANRVKGAAEQAMKAQLDEEIQQYMS